MKFMNNRFSFDNHFIRFLIVGFINTIFTYIIYLVCLQMMYYIYAYTVSFVSGIVFAYLLNARAVFQNSLEFKKLIYFTLNYCGQYLIGRYLLLFFVENGVNVKIAPWLVLLVSVPINFTCIKIIFKERNVC
jgi:putative flippase GtrA